MLVQLTYPLLILLVDRIQCVLDGNALEVPCRDLKAEGEVEVNLLDGGCREEFLESIPLLRCCRRCVDLPGTPGLVRSGSKHRRHSGWDLPA